MLWPLAELQQGTIIPDLAAFSCPPPWDVRFGALLRCHSSIRESLVCWHFWFSFSLSFQVREETCTMVCFLWYSCMDEWGGCYSVMLTSRFLALSAPFYSLNMGTALQADLLQALMTGLLHFPTLGLWTLGSPVTQGHSLSGELYGLCMVMFY